MDGKIIVGPIAEISLPEINQAVFLARVDTGAQTSAVWAESVRHKNGNLEVVFFGPTSPLYTGEKVAFKNYEETTVTNSTGKTEKRWKVRLIVEIGGKRVRSRFTLANRSKQMYPVLLGRNVLRGKFIVDITHKAKVNA